MLLSIELKWYNRRLIPFTVMMISILVYMHVSNGNSIMTARRVSSCKKNISNLHSSKKDSRHRDNPFDNLDPLKIRHLEKLLWWPQTTSNTNQQHRFSRSWRSKQWPIVNQRARLCLSLDLSSFHIRFRFPRYRYVDSSIRWLVLNVLQWRSYKCILDSKKKKKKEILRHDRSNQSSRPPAFLFLRWFIARVSLLLVSL